MHMLSQATTIGALFIMLVACTPASRVQPASPGSGSPAGSSQDAASKTLVLMTWGEPDTLSGTAVVAPAGTTSGRRRLFNAGLTLLDGNLRPLPYLAESLPQLDTETWRVSPDGRMETTYQLRADLAWHDGAPLTANDFVFAYQVYSTPEFGQSGTEPIPLIESVDAPNPRTLVIRWRGAYAEAGLLEAVVSTGVPTGGPTFTPLPRHILGPIYQDQREVFLTNPFWSVEFVGAGPYRLDRWEVGAFIEAVAFNQHALGRPKIDRVRLVWNSDQSVVLATILSGDAHVAIDGAIALEAGLVLRREWANRGGGDVQFIPKNWRYLALQSRAAYASPQAILDLRVRKSLASAIDKQALIDGIWEGMAVASDSMMHPTVPYFQELDRTVAKYPFDQRRAEAFMQEAGYRKGGDGFYESPDEGRLLFQMASSGGQIGKERTALADGWRRAGLNMEDREFSTADRRDGQVIATFRSIQINGAPPGLQAMGFFSSGTIPGPENRWVGANLGGWSHPEYDRALDSVRTTLEPGARGRAVIELTRIVSEYLPTISLYFVPWVNVLPNAVQGIDMQVGNAEQTWNIYQWQLQ